MFLAKDVIHFWFQGQFEDQAGLHDKAEIWFRVNRKQDRHIRKRLLTYTTLASEDGLKDWESSPHGALALVLLLDRVTRACYRGTPLVYDNDAKARSLALKALERGWDMALEPVERSFLLFPLLASEKLNHQILFRDRLESYCPMANGDTLLYLTNLIELTKRNILVLHRYKRFPHRAKSIRRALRPDELKFVETYDWQDWL